MQNTLRNPVSCSGIGLHSGAVVNMTLMPAGPDHGIVFRRTDVPPEIGEVPARYDLVSDTRLGTTIRNEDGVTVSTIEHLMAALWGAEIDNALVILDAPEVPIMDGSSEPFSFMLDCAGLRPQEQPRLLLRVLRPVEVQEGESRAAVGPAQDGALRLDITIDFKHSLIGREQGVYDFSSASFKQSLSRARTFGFEHEVAAMRSMGLALGGSLENAVVVGKDRILNEGGLRYGDEFLRHKALDCLGDYFLAGHRILGEFTCYRPGHQINNLLLHALFSDRKAWALTPEFPASAVPAAIYGGASAQA